MVYLSNRDENERDRSVVEWRALTNHNSYNFTKFMTTESQILKHKGEGLPGDELSI